MARKFKRIADVELYHAMLPAMHRLLHDEHEMGNNCAGHANLHPVHLFTVGVLVGMRTSVEYPRVARAIWQRIYNTEMGRDTQPIGTIDSFVGNIVDVLTEDAGEDVTLDWWERLKKSYAPEEHDGPFTPVWVGGELTWQPGAIGTGPQDTLPDWGDEV